MTSKPYRLVIANRFTKDLRQLDPQIRERILQALAKLEENPYQGEKVLVQETGTWRLRVGDWRLRYDIVGEEVHLLRARHRREVYRQD
jgi:mRNA interferase RelE/StbE